MSVCLFMGLCVSALFVGPKCALNLDGETSMFTFIISLTSCKSLRRCLGLLAGFIGL